MKVETSTYMKDELLNLPLRRGDLSPNLSFE